MNPVVKRRILRQLSARPAEEIQDLLQRAEIQLEFAAAFAQAINLPQPTKDKIHKATEDLNAFNPSEGLHALKALITKTENDLDDVGQLAKTYTIHCVGHGHIDMNWMWSWPETVSMTHDTFASVLNLMEQYPDLTYSQSQASVYAAIQKHHPEMFEQIKQRVKEGRWEVTASHWVEGDKNLTSGESLCRHLLYTRDYFQEHFGLSPEDVPIDWEPDTFGHANTIPMIDSAGAVKYYYACRTGGGQGHPRIGEERPPLFYWQAPDGSRVLVNKETTWYNSYVNIGDNVALPMVDFIAKTGLHHWLNVYGIGNHGGGPTRVEIEYLKKLDSWPIYPRVVFSTAKRYFEAVDQEANGNLPVLDHELNFEFTGCYTSQSLIKQANRYGENYCIEAETLALLAAMTKPSANTQFSILNTQGSTLNAFDKRAEIKEAWIKVLFNQFHDILPGSGVRETREYARGLFQEVGATTGAIKRDALKKLASNIDTARMLPDTPEGREELVLGAAANTPFVAGSGIEAGSNGYSVARGGGNRFRPFVIYNPCAWDRVEPVKITLYDTDFDPEHIVARDEQGRCHPTHFMEKGHDWGHDKITVLFYPEVPALGYRTFIFCEGVPTVEVPLVTALDRHTFKTPILKCEFDEQDGGFRSIYLQQSHRWLVARDPSFGAWLKQIERGEQMNAWILGDTRNEEPLQSTSFRTSGHGHNIGTGLPAGKSLAITAEWSLQVPNSNGSKVGVQALINPFLPRIDFEAEIDWREFGSREDGIPGLVVGFPFAFVDPAAGSDQPEDQVFSHIEHLAVETPFGSLTRRWHDVVETYGRSENCTLRYLHIPDTGVTIVQDGKYGFEGSGPEIGMRVLRSSHEPDHAPEIAKSKLRYAIYLHEEQPTAAELTRLGAAWNHPFIVAPANIQTGSGSPVQSFARVTTPNFVLTSIKQAEHQDGVVLRLVDYDGAGGEGEVELNPVLLDGRSKVQCVDVLERPIEGKAVLEANVLRVAVKPRGFVTVLVT